MGAYSAVPIGFVLTVLYFGRANLGRSRKAGGAAAKAESELYVMKESQLCSGADASSNVTIS